MNLTQLTAQLVALANRRDFTSNTALQTVFINQGIQRIQRELRVPAMEKSVLVTMNGIGSVTIGGTAFPIATGQYNQVTGVVQLNLANTVAGVVPNVAVGNSVNVTALGGSGAISTCIGTFTAAVGSTGYTLYLQIATKLVLQIATQQLIIPGDFIELQKIIPQTGDPRQRACIKADIDTVYALSLVTDTPNRYARQGGVWVLGPSPAVNSVVRVDYFAELGQLVNPTDTNVISVIAWDLIVYAGLVQLGIYYKDARTGTINPQTGKYMDGWGGQYEQIKQALQDQSDEDDENGYACVQPTYAWPPDWGFEQY